MAASAAAANLTLVDLELLQLLKSIADANGIHKYDGGWMPPAQTDLNYVAPNKGNALFITNIVLMVVTVFVVMARFYTRSFIAGGMGGDDYAIGAATLILMGSTALNSYGVKEGGWGKHFYDLSPSEFRNFLKAVYALPIVYSLGVFSVKFSILLFYRRLFGMKRNMQRLVLWFIAFQAIFAIASCFTFAFICHPIKGWWVLSMRVESCPNFHHTAAIWVSMRAVTVLCDIIVVLLPLKLVAELDLPLRQRLGLSSLFALGTVACVIAIARLALLPNMLLTLDVSWNVLPIALLDQIEQSLGIITSSLPALTAIISKVQGRIRKPMFSNNSIELRKKSGEQPRSSSVAEFDFLSFAYDPDRQNTKAYTTSYAYSTSKPITKSKWLGRSGHTNTEPIRPPMHSSTQSDENLVENATGPGINKSTTITVNLA